MQKKISADWDHCFRFDVCDLPLDVLDLICERCRIRGLCYNAQSGGENECNAKEIIDGVVC